MLFFGFRGCRPISPQDHAFRSEHRVEGADIDYVHPRCTLAQWLPHRGAFALYPGSTVPHRDNIQGSIPAGGVGTNELLTGYFTDYRKGWHKQGKPTGHQAFRQTGDRIYRRTANDLRYGSDDPFYEGNVNDNLHAAWCSHYEAPRYASAGCQVVVGFPQCPARNNQPGTGPWKAFYGVAQEQSQDRFGYVLLNGRDLKRLALNGPEGMERVRLGSEGDRARRVQQALAERGFYEGMIDSRFGPRSTRALMEFQEAVFGPLEDDGICGPATAAALEIDWP
jgi:hypothetical protein